MIKAVNSAHAMSSSTTRHIFVLPVFPPSFFHDDIDVVQTSSRSYYGILEQSIIYTAPNRPSICIIIYWTVNSTRRWITAALAATKLKTLLTHHISLMHQADIYYYVPCRLPSHRLRGIISSDIHHSIGGYYPCTPITRNEATNVDILYTLLS